MLVITLAQLLFLTLIAGLLGVLIFPALAFCFLVNFAALTIFCKEINQEISTDTNTDRDPENVPLQERDTQDGMTNNYQPTRPQGPANRAAGKEESFFFIAALCSIWLPSVVGQHRKIFLVSGLTSLICKLILLTIALTLSESGLQGHVYERPLLLFCFKENELPDGVTSCRGFFGEGSCFSNTNNTVTNEVKFLDAVTKLGDAFSAYEDEVAQIDASKAKQGNAENANSFKNRLQQGRAFLTEIEEWRTEISEKLQSANVGHIQQRVRVCEEDEIVFFLCLLLGVLTATVSTILATWSLHKRADYKVNVFNEMFFIITEQNFPRSFSRYPGGSYIVSPALCSE